MWGRLTGLQHGLQGYALRVFGTHLAHVDDRPGVQGANCNRATSAVVVAPEEWRHEVRRRNARHVE